MGRHTSVPPFSCVPEVKRRVSARYFAWNEVVCWLCCCCSHRALVGTRKTKAPTRRIRVVSDGRGLLSAPKKHGSENNKEALDPSSQMCRLYFSRFGPCLEDADHET